MSDVLRIRLDSWIIQDGNYPDFTVGQRAAFALELRAQERFTTIDGAGAIRQLEHFHDGEYEVTGEVVFAVDTWWVLDVGLLLFRDDARDLPARGTWVRGAVHLGVDPFFYFAQRAPQLGAPALIYDWTIEAIQVQTGPFTEVARNAMARDPARLGWRDITETSAWGEDDGNAEYLLHCRRVDGAPRRTR